MARKKTFVNDPALYDDPALSFISREAREEEPGPRPPAPGAGRPAPAQGESRSRRVQLVMQPSLYARAKEASEQAGLSFNEFCRQALEQALETGIYP